MQDSDFQVKLEKSIFYIYKIEYLGYIIAENRIKMDPIKISMIKGWPTPGNISEVQSFLEFTNFYYRFIKKYSQITANLINLTKKGYKWVWNKITEEAFKELKKQFIKEPVLK